MAGGDAPPLPHPVEAAFHHLASLVDLTVEGRWPAAAAAAPGSVSDLVSTFGDGRGDAPTPQPGAGSPGADAGPRTASFGPRRQLQAGHACVNELFTLQFALQDVEYKVGE